MHAVLGRRLHDVHAGVVVALDELQLAAGQNGHVPADDTQTRQRLRGAAAEVTDLRPLRDHLAPEGYAGHRVAEVAVAVLVETVGHDDAGCRVDLAEDAAAVGVVNVQAVVADAQPRAEDLKAVAAAEGDDAQRVERRRVKARERIIGLHELLGQILARAQLVKQCLPVGRGVPLGLGQLAEADAPA